MTRSANRRIERSTASVSGAPKFIRQAISPHPKRGILHDPVDAFGRFADDEMVGVDLSCRAGRRPELGDVLMPPGVVKTQKATGEELHGRIFGRAVRDDVDDPV
jgi:hypothetical protein